VTTDAAAAAEIANAAGQVLLDVRTSGPTGSELKDAGDLAAHRCIVELLAQRFPDDAVLSEEGAKDPRDPEVSRIWIVDPVDGTREFSEPPRDDWAVHVALVESGELVAGAVALPAQGVTYSSDGPLPDRPAAPSSPRVLVSRTRPTEHAKAVASALDGVLVPMGSAGAKAMAVVSGQAEIYAHSGGQYEWDSAAPVAVAAAAGLHVSRLDGSPLVYDQPDPWLPDLLICRPELAADVIAICQEVHP
jgi:3'(2'), 5'-bisphosphate nucleotidase